WQSVNQDGSDFGVYGRSYSADGLDLGGSRLNTYTTGNQWQPSVAMDVNGGFVVAWESNGQDGDGPGNFARRFRTAGRPQGDEFQVNAVGAGSQFDPSIAMDRNGNFLIAWYAGGGIIARRYSATGLPRGAEFSVNTAIGGEQRRPSVAMDSDGDFVVAWESEYQDGSGSSVHARRFNAAGMPSIDELRVNTT